MSIDLSILVPTLESRKILLERMLKSLGTVPSNVEVLIESDNGKISIGQKRNLLLTKATGKYVAFIDDDDVVASSYIQKVLSAITSIPDCVGIHLLHFNDGNLAGLTYHSLDYKNWFEASDGCIGLKWYYRNPNHLNPVKRELALKVMFPEISMGEDRDYSMRLLPLLQSEVYIREPIFYYLYRSQK